MATPYPVALSVVSGFGGTILLPIPIAAIAANTTLETILTNTTPTDVGLPVSIRRAPLSDATGNTALAFIGLESSSTIAFDATLGFALTVPPSAIVSAADYYVAFYDPSAPNLGWQLDYAGPATIAGTTLTFGSVSSGKIWVLAAAVRYWWALYARSHAAVPPTPVPATPSPVPSGVETPAPTPPPPTPIPSFVISPSTIAFTAPGQTTSFTVDASPGNGMLSASTSNAQVATVAQFGPNTFVVTAGSVAGVTTITVSGSISGSATVTVGLTTTTGTFY